MITLEVKKAICNITVKIFIPIMANHLRCCIFEDPGHARVFLEGGFVRHCPARPLDLIISYCQIFKQLFLLCARRSESCDEMVSSTAWRGRYDPL